MYPIIFDFGGGLKIGSYGVMMAVGFITAYYLLKAQLYRIGYDENLAQDLIVYGAFFGILGAKLMDIIEEWPNFLKDPVGSLFAGLTWHGGVILAGIVVIYIFKKRNLDILKMGDIIAPLLAIGYGIGRMGCHIAGDGDFGIITNSKILGMPFPSAIVPVDAPYPGFSPLRDTSLYVYPTTLWETIYNFILFIFLWKFSYKYKYPKGFVLALYGIFAGLERFLVEFIRRNPKILGPFTNAQLYSIAIMIAGIIGVIYLLKKQKIEKVV